jgi:endonuclease YncB( thermonuclease family)
MPTCSQYFYLLIEAERGKDFRIVARVMADGKDIGRTLIDRGMAVAYDGGNKNQGMVPSAVPFESRVTCTPRKKGSEMSSCRETYFHLRECQATRLDRDMDGVPCESMC